MVSFSSEESRTDEWKDAGCWLGATKVQGSGMQAAGSYRHQLLKGKVKPCQGKIWCYLHASQVSGTRF